jgi:hypothetical protein
MVANVGDVSKTGRIDSLKKTQKRGFYLNVLYAKFDIWSVEAPFTPAL